MNNDYSVLQSHGLTDEDVETQECTEIACEHCGEDVDREDAYFVREALYCDECVSSCIGCGDSVVTAESIVTHGGDVIGDCCRDDYSECEHCSCVVHYEEIGFVNDETPYCQECLSYHCVYCDECEQWHNGQVCGSAYINDYNFRVPLEFRRGRKESSGLKDYFGLEVEVEADNDLAEDVDALDYLFCKEDGSVPAGFEIVSQPGTLAFWQESRPELESLLENLINRGARSYKTSTCGMHIHINKKAFKSALHIFKFQALIYNNPAFTLFFSRRKAEHLENWASLTKESTNDLVKKAKGEGDTYERYIAVNLPNAVKTVEVRMFRGTLSVDGIYRNLEYCAALLAWSEKASIAACNGMASFLKYVSDNRKLYGTLYSFLKLQNRVR